MAVFKSLSLFEDLQGRGKVAEVAKEDDSEVKLGLV
jgi:hypothetical protein